MCACVAYLEAVRCVVTRKRRVTGPGERVVVPDHQLSHQASASHTAYSCTPESADNTHTHTTFSQRVVDTVTCP